MMAGCVGDATLGCHYRGSRSLARKRGQKLRDRFKASIA